MSLKEIPIKINGYNTMEFLGKGTFSNVYKCKKNDKNYALKRINSNDNFIRYAKKEINFLSKIENHNIVEMVDNFMVDKIQYLVFEYLNDNLYNFFLKKKEVIDFDKFSKYSYQIADGLSYIHSKNIVHCDLKLENIMLTHDIHKLKIIDFGSSRNDNYIIQNNFYIQSRYYRAPEILYEINFNPKIDIWSFGIIMTELIFKKCIFNGKNNIEMIYKLCDYLNIPNLQIYKNSILYDKLFKNSDNEIVYSDKCLNYNVKGFRINRLDEYLYYYLKKYFLNIYDYQIDKIISFINKILDYNHTTRLSAEECKKELKLFESN
tara:strand:+ start:2393 stop:3352 length:960 start_codon:yes stop_codon:yes gene_type:complete